MLFMSEETERPYGLEIVDMVNFGHEKAPAHCTLRPVRKTVRAEVNVLYCYIIMYITLLAQCLVKLSINLYRLSFGNRSELRELRKASTTTLFSKDFKGTRLIAVPNGKKVEDVTIGNPHPSF